MLKILVENKLTAGWVWISREHRYGVKLTCMNLICIDGKRNRRNSVWIVFILIE